MGGKEREGERGGRKREGGREGWEEERGGRKREGEEREGGREGWEEERGGRKREGGRSCHFRYGSHFVIALSYSANCSTVPQTLSTGPLPMLRAVRQQHTDTH